MKSFWRVASEYSFRDTRHDKPGSSLRPHGLESFIGQEKAKSILRMAIRSSIIRNAPPGHIVFYGPAGLGKTSLANVLANELNYKLYVVNGNSNSGLILETLKKIEPYSVVFIDEIHALSIGTQEVLYEAMEDAVLNVEKEQIKLPPFTLVGATTMLGNLSKPMIDRFLLKIELKPYSIEELALMTSRKALAVGIEIDKDASLSIAKRCRSTARLLANHVTLCRDFALGMGEQRINSDVVEEVFQTLEIDALGLGTKDYEYLETVYANEKPMGAGAIALTINEALPTVELLIEPYLLQLGYISRTPRGRCITNKGIELLERRI